MAENVTGIDGKGDPSNFGFPTPAKDIHVEPTIEQQQRQIQAETLINFAREVRSLPWTDQSTANAIADKAEIQANKLTKGA